MSLAPVGPALVSPAGLRLLAAPCSDPPYDDERPGGQPLPLRPRGVPRRRLRVLPPWPTEDNAEEDRADPPLPPARPFAHGFVQRVLEVLAGVRPLAQLQRDTSPDVYEALEQMLAARPRSTGPRPDGRAVRSLRIQQRPPGVAEVAATVCRGTRYGALALRLEGADGRWRCTELAGA